MNRGREASSDRLTVIFLLLVCTLSFVLVCCIAYFLYITFSPAPAQSPAALADNQSKTDNPDITSPAGGEDQYAGSMAYIGELDAGAVAVLDAATGRSLGEIRTNALACGIAVAAGGDRVYVNSRDGIAVVDVRTGRIVNNVTTSHAPSNFFLLSPDNAYLYVACSGGLSVITLAGNGGNEVAFIDGVTATGIGVSPDGKFVYTTDWWNSRLQVVDIDRRQIAKTIDLIPDNYPHSTQPWEGKTVMAAGQAEALAVSPDGNYAVVGMWASSYVAVVDLRTLSLSKWIRLSGRSFQGEAYSPDGKYVYVADYDGSDIIVLDGSTYAPLSAFAVAERPRNIAVAPGGEYMYVAHDHGNTEIVRLPYGGNLMTLDVVANKEGSNIAFTPAVAQNIDQGPGIATGSPTPAAPGSAGTQTPIDGTVKGSKAYMCQDFTSNVTVLDADTGSVLDEIRLPAVVSGVAASHDGNYVYISTYNGVYLVDSRTDRIVNSVTISKHMTTGFLAVSPDDRSLYVVCSDGMEVIALDGDDGEPVAFTPGVKAMGIGISPDGRYVFTTDWSNCSLQVYNTTDRYIEETIDLVPGYYSHENLSLKGTMINAAGQAGGIAVSPDGSHALVGIWYGTFISAVDLKAMAFEKAIHLYRPSNRCAVYSPDGSLVYLMCYDYGVISILNGSSFEEIKSFGVGPWPVDIAITPDGQYLYVSYQQSDMDVYHLPEGTRVRTINNTPRWSGTHIAFTPAAS